MFNPPHPLSYRGQIRDWLLEDWGTQDWTSNSVPDRPMGAVIRAKEQLVLSGLPMAGEIFKTVDPSLEIEEIASDGKLVMPGTEVLGIVGSSRSILMAERVVLNILQRLSGTATLTARFVEAISGTDAVVLDTRKTTPGLKILEKYAVRCGGGRNHRINLGDGILIKENHIAAAGGISAAVHAARKAAPNLVKIEIEVETLIQLEEALQESQASGALLDNMDLETMRKAVQMRNASLRNFFLEASGNMSLERARSVALTGVDFLSVGALTHSAPAVDLSLRMQ